MDNYLAGIKKLYDSSTEEDCISIVKSLTDLLNTLEGPKGAMWRIFNGLSIIRVGSDLRIFSHLNNSKEPLSINQLSEATGAAAELLVRLLRYLSSASIIAQISPIHFSPTLICQLFGSPQGEALLIHGFDGICPPLLALPEFLQSHHYQNINDPRHTPYQQAFNTSLLSFEHIAQPENKRLYAAFQTVMTTMQDSRWMAGFPVLDQMVGEAQDYETPFFVDVGGGRGHQCAELLKRYPELQGKVVLEDLPAAVRKLEPVQGVEVIEQDFFQEQIVKGARFYYLRRILHDWPPAESRIILANLAAAMDPKSRILIDEISLPDMNVSLQAAMQDVVLMVQMAGVERTRSEWKELIDSVKGAQGESLLEAESVVEYAKETHGCITVLKLR